MRKGTFPVLCAVSFLFCVTSLQAGQYSTSPATPAAAGQSTYTIKAELLDPDQKAKQREATVVVSTQGVELVDPASVNQKPRVGQGHLHYRVDQGPVIATTATKLSFHELSPGTRQIEVTLVGNDHKPLSAPIKFTLQVPES